jgi:uncharacterized membrane protein
MNEVGHPPSTGTLQSSAVLYMAIAVPSWLPVVKMAIAVHFSASVNHFAMRTNPQGMQQPFDEHLARFR